MMTGLMVLMIITVAVDFYGPTHILGMMMMMMKAEVIKHYLAEVALQGLYNLESRPRNELSIFVDPFFSVFLMSLF